MAQASIRDLLKKSDMLLMAVCVVAAAIFLVLAGENVASAGNFLTIDSLFFTSVCLLLALTFVAVPACSSASTWRCARRAPRRIAPSTRRTS